MSKKRLDKWSTMCKAGTGSRCLSMSHEHREPGETMRSSRENLQRSKQGRPSTLSNIKERLLLETPARD